MSHRATSLLLLASLAVVISGCASITDPSPRSEPSSDTTASPTPPSALVEPAASIPVDCTNALQADAVTRVAASARFDPGAPSAFATARELQNGTLSCSWISDEGADRTYVFLSINRHVALLKAQPGADEAGAGMGADVGADESTASSSNDPTGVQASIQAFVGDYRVFVYARAALGTDPLSILRPSVKSLVAQLRATPLPTWARPANAWPQGLSCEKVAARANLSAVLDHPGLIAQDTTGLSEDSTTTEDLATIGGERDCTWHVRETPSDAAFIVELRTLAGGGWAWGDYITKSTGRRISVENTDGAVVECRPQLGCLVEARMGQNLFQVGQALYADPLTEQQATDAATAVAAALQAEYGA